MYGFIHCCLEDMVLQLFGEAAWREILNVAGIKLRGASFLMHQVYDDETTFKLVAAASQVSGLPMEACLEAFGRHFLVYCQKNGYDQILRVLGSNLYDFLTNLDNLHDHLASIYPGMRAPSFRVTRNLESNGGGGAGDQSPGDAGSVRLLQVQAQQQQQQQHRDQSEGEGEHNDTHISLAAGSMYLHYYSERNGLSPIVKGLVLAVAKEFFSTDIVVTECKLLRPQLGHADDHVVLKIDRRSQVDMLLDEQTSQAVELAAALAAASSPASSSGQAQQVSSPSRTPVPAPRPPADPAQAELARSRLQQSQQQQRTMLMSAIYGDSLSKLASDSLINSEIVMQTFPFHVIFDRHFNLVQVGNALLRVTSFYWMRRQKQRKRPTSGSAACKPDDLVKFSDLFSIVRPKIEFTFDAIADHTNQVFVVKTRPLVLNADYLRSVAGQSEDGADVPSGVCSATVTPTSAKPPPGGGSLCPMNRMAMKRRSCAPRLAIEREHSRTSTAGEDHEGGGGGDDDQKTNQSPQEPAARQGRHQASSVPSPSHGHENDSGGEYSAFNLLSLRLKGQMIILSGPMGQQQPPAQTQTQTPTQTQTQSDQINQDRQRPAASPWQPQGPFCLYLCSPRVDHLDQLMECGVKMSDLALHDRARELMLMSHTHKEDREAVKKLDQATNDLKKMDTKLRQENKRTNEVLHNIFPAKIATLLSHGTKIESESFDPVTCLYSDIIGFTKMCGSENVRPIDIVRLLNTLYLQFDNLTNIHGVYKVETIGDAYVIVGGLPEPVEDHADRCVRMGLDMVKVIATVRSPADNEPIQMRIGIHSGPVMAGIVGIRVPRYSLFGNTTTLANQLEAHGVGGKIHISDFTLKNLIKRDRFVIEDNAKQISGFPFKTYFVTNYLSDEKELLKHEKILEEQLIRDFELMGNEVELVEDNSGHSGATAQLRARIATRGQLAANSTQRQRQQQQQQHDSTSCQNQNSQQPKQGAQDQESQVHEPREQVKSKAIVLMDVEGAYLRPLSADGQQPGGQREGVSRKQSREKRRKMPTRELVEMSCKLSDEILEDAVRQFADLQTLDRLLALLASRQMGLNSHIGWGSGYKMDAKATRLKLPPLAGFIPTPKEEEEQPQKQQQQQQEAQGSAAQSNLAPANQQPERPTQAGGSCCPFCLGDGRLQLDDGGLQQVKLVAAAVSVALTSIGSIKFPSGGGIGNSQQQQHPNERFTRFFNLLINNPTLSGGSANVMTIKTQAASSVCQTKPLDGQTSSGTSPAATSTASQTPDSKQRWSSGAADTMAGSSNTPRGGSITRAAAAAAQVQGANEGLRDSNSETEEQPLVDGLQIILSNLRLEREKLSTQVERLADQLKELGRLEPITTTTSGRPKEDSIETAEDEDEARFPLMLLKLQQQQQQQQAATADGLSGALAKPVGVPCGFNLQNRSPLSSNIHRMRRMDTLKRRKIKREEQSQQQQSQYSALTSPLSSASSTICETPNTSTCRTLSSPTSRGEQKTWTRKEALTRTMSSGGGRPGCSSEPIIESDDEENDGSVKVVAAAAAAAAGPNPTSRPMAAPGGQRSNEQISRSQDTARSRQHPPTPSPPSATYIYQSFRSSLASLMNETVSQTLAQAQQEPNANELRRVQNQQKLNQTTSEQQEKRKRFSLSSLGTSLSSAIVSPFLSPKKMAFQQQQQQHVKRVASNEINASERPPALAAASQGDRKSSSPHSSSSNGNQRRQQQQQQQQQQSGRPGSGGGTSALMKQSSNSANNCSCLKSSGSSQSVKSDLR